jgi:hypothetical protein
MKDENERRTARDASAASRSERLAAELKANLKKRKEQARARRHASAPQPFPAEDDESGE